MELPFPAHPQPRVSSPPLPRLAQLQRNSWFQNPARVLPPFHKAIIACLGLAKATRFKLCCSGQEGPGRVAAIQSEAPRTR